MRMRGLSSLAVSLLVVVGMFRLWPLPSSEDSNSDLLTAVRPQEIIELELIEQTVQDYAVPPAPPPPPPPEWSTHDLCFPFSMALAPLY